MKTVLRKEQNVYDFKYYAVDTGATGIKIKLTKH